MREPSAQTTPETVHWHALAPATVLTRLDSAPARGLAQEEANRRRAVHGPNELQEGARRSPLRVFGAQFSDFMIIVLLVAAGVSGTVGDIGDALAILVIVVLNAAVGALQEIRAERAVAALGRMAQPNARVLRDGQWCSEPATMLVPGDVVELEAGNVVPADLRLVDVADLHIDESPLTGESLPVEKDADAELAPEVTVGDRCNMAYRGTLVTSGRGRGVTVATGMASEIGRIAGLLEDAKTPRTPLQRRLARFGVQLSVVVLLICALLFAAGLARGEPAIVMFLTAVSLAVAAIPEALPAVITVSLALGARKMTARNALVRRLPAVETLGSVTVVCSDKTGTLTQNRMRVDALWANDERRDAIPTDNTAGGPWDLLARVFVQNNDAHVQADEEAFVGDPTEVALIEAGRAAGYEARTLEASSPRIDEIAFEGSRRRMTTLHAEGNAAIAFVKGAPETVLPRCTTAFTEDGPGALDGTAVLATAEQLANEGYRVLAFAFRHFASVPDGRTADELESELHFLGLAGLLDPPRDEAAGAISVCRSAGIRPVMITGDHPGTARAIAGRIGIAPDDAQVLTGADLERLSSDELTARVEDVSVFARVSPEQKIDLVRALQERGEFVAMTGDGVNDAPALKRAEIGIAMGKSGTEVAREAADMTLLDDNFATIVSAVREGRRVFDNIRKFVKYTMTSNAGEIWTLFLAPFFGLPLPLLPIQILWINLVTDGLPGLALSVEPAEGELMHRPPRAPNESLFAHGMWQHVVWVGLWIATLSIGAQAWAHGAGSENWQTVVFTVLTLSQLAHALAIRSERESLLARGLRSNMMLLGAVALTALLQLAVVYTPVLQSIFHTSALSATELAVCFALPLAVLAGVELEKLLVRRGLLYRSRSRRTRPQEAH